MRSGLIVVFAVSLATPVLAQTSSSPGPSQSPTPRSTPGEIIVDPNAHGEHGDSARVPLPPEGPGRVTFLQDMVRFNPKTNEAFIGTRPLGAQEFYNEVGRPDLAARSAERTRQRTWLIVGSVVTLAAGVASGVVVLGNAQSLGDGKCFAAPQPAVYNDCVDRNHQTTTIGTILIASGVVLGGGLFTWAMTLSEMVTTPEESAKLALEHDRSLAKKYGAPEAKLDVLPSIGPGFAGITARLTF